MQEKKAETETNQPTRNTEPQKVLEDNNPEPKIGRGDPELQMRLGCSECWRGKARSPVQYFANWGSAGRLSSEFCAVLGLVAVFRPHFVVLRVPHDSKSLTSLEIWRRRAALFVVQRRTLLATCSHTLDALSPWWCRRARMIWLVFLGLLPGRRSVINLAFRYR